jgi:hypothetical protein
MTAEEKKSHNEMKKKQHTSAQSAKQNTSIPMGQMGFPWTP